MAEATTNHVAEGEEHKKGKCGNEVRGKPKQQIEEMNRDVAEGVINFIENTDHSDKERETEETKILLLLTPRLK